MVIAVGTGQNLLALPVVGDIHNRSESHVAAGGLDLSAGDAAHGLGILRIAGSADLHLGGDEGAVGADTAAALLGVAGDEHGDLGVLLQQTVLIQDHLTGHTVVAAAAQLVGFHQVLQVLLGVAGSELPEQLADLLLVGHGGNGAFHPSDVFITQVIRLCS